MRVLRCSVAIVLLHVGCYSPNPALLADSDSPSAGSSETTDAADTTSGAPSTTEPSSTDAGTDPASSSSTPSAADSESSDGNIETSDTLADSTSSTGEFPDCVGKAGRTVWINFDGGTLEQGVIDNGPGWVVELPAMVGDWPAYDDATEGDADEIMAILRDQWSPFDVCFTRERPDALDYELVLVSSTTFMGNPNYGGPGAQPDCGDVEVNNVVVRTLSPEANLPTPTKAIAITEALGRSFGLELVGASEDLMNYAVGTTLNSATFTDTCQPLQFTQNCAESPGCDPGEQNSYAVLMQLLGPA